MDDNSPSRDDQHPTETDNINSTITNDHNNNVDTTSNNIDAVNPDNTHNQSLEEDDDPYTDVSSISEEGGTEKLQRNFSNLSGKVSGGYVLFSYECSILKSRCMIKSLLYRSLYVFNIRYILNNMYTLLFLFIYNVKHYRKG